MMRWHILIVSKNSSFPRLSGEADRTAAGPSSPTTLAAPVGETKPRPAIEVRG
jgi:hypothetical protein